MGKPGFLHHADFYENHCSAGLWPRLQGQTYGAARIWARTLAHLYQQAGSLHHNLSKTLAGNQG